jgi:hypothetical protein
MEKPNNHRGRPRKHLSNADKQKAYRERKEADLPPKPSQYNSEGEFIHAWDKYLVRTGGMDKGKYDKALGMLHTGGNDWRNFEYLDEMKNAREAGCGEGGGHKVVPQGWNPASFENGGTLYDDGLWVLAIFRNTEVGKLNINLDSEIFGLLNDSGHVYPSKLTFKIVGSGIPQMIFANRNGAIEQLVRRRKLPISLQIGGCKITLIVDARAYKKEFCRLAGVLTLFEPNGSADLRSSLADVQTVLALHDGNLNKSGLWAMKAQRRVAATPRANHVVSFSMSSDFRTIPHLFGVPLYPRNNALHLMQRIISSGCD